MANGQQKAQQNLDAFEVWRVTQTDDDFKQIIFRGQLNRGEAHRCSILCIDFSVILHGLILYRLSAFY